MSKSPGIPFSKGKWAELNSEVLPKKVQSTFQQ